MINPIPQQVLNHIHSIIIEDIIVYLKKKSHIALKNRSRKTKSARNVPR
jgi:hypothetical protein